MKALVWLVILAGLAASVQCQTSLRTTAGGDQIYDSYGLQTEFKWHKLSGWTGMGYNSGLQYGGYLKIPIKTGESNTGYYMGLGDQRLSALLDTDEYDSHGFSARGVNIVHRTSNSSTQIFSGLLSQEVALPFMHTSRTASGDIFQTTPLGAMIYQHRLSKTLQLHSLNLLYGKMTSIESIGWTPSKMWRFSGAAGMGAGARYLAGACDFSQKRLDVRTSYTVAGKDFQRQEQPYYSTELMGFNARVVLTPIDALRLRFNHEKSRTNIIGFPSVLGTFDSANLSAIVKGFQFSPSVSVMSTERSSEQTITEMIAGSKQIVPEWRTFGAFIHVKSPSSEQQTFVSVNEFRVSSRLAIRQNYNRMSGQNNFSMGAQWVSNRISFSVDQQVYISPLASTLGGKSVFQAWAFNLRMRTPHGSSANLNTIVTPDGKMQWGGYLSGLRYDSVGLEHSNATPTFSKYIIRGVVLDETGKGVWGVAVKIGSDTVLSDEAGEFYLDVKNAKPLALMVAKGSSIQTSYWRLTSAPATAQGQLEAGPTEPLQIIVNTVRS